MASPSKKQCTKKKRKEGIRCKEVLKNGRKCDKLLLGKDELAIYCERCNEPTKFLVLLREALEKGYLTKEVIFKSVPALFAETSFVSNPEERIKESKMTLKERLEKFKQKEKEIIIHPNDDTTGWRWKWGKIEEVGDDYVVLINRDTGEPQTIPLAAISTLSTDVEKYEEVLRKEWGYKGPKVELTEEQKKALEVVRGLSREVRGKALQGATSKRKFSISIGKAIQLAFGVVCIAFFWVGCGMAIWLSLGESIMWTINDPSLHILGISLVSVIIGGLLCVSITRPERKEEEEYKVVKKIFWKDMGWALTVLTIAAILISLFKLHWAYILPVWIGTGVFLVACNIYHKAKRNEKIPVRKETPTPIPRDIFWKYIGWTVTAMAVVIALAISLRFHWAYILPTWIVTGIFLAVWWGGIVGNITTPGQCPFDRDQSH